MWGDWGPDSGWGMGFGMIGMALFWILVIAGIVALVGWTTGSGSSSSPPPGKTPIDLLNERYARGEIDRREFEEKKRDLSR